MTRPDKPTLPLAPGSGFGPYRLVRRLGVGGFAEVWEAERDDGIGSVALKILSAAKDVEPSALERFIQEGRIAAALSHPRTVYVFAAEQVGTHPVIAMELMRGGTLQDRLDRGERFSPAEVVEIALDLLDGLEAAHRQGIVHRDLKPSNCMLDESGRVKLGDFGISRSVTTETRLTMTGQIVGTPTFSAPEQIRGEAADARSDLYSLGATLYALLEGRPPFEGRNWGEVVSRVLTEDPAPPRAGGRAPARLQRLVLELLERDPSRRPSDYAALRADLLALSARPLAPATPLRRTAAGIVEIVIYMLVAGPVLAALGERSERGVAPLIAALFQVAFGTLFEWRWGGTPGKLLLGLRISGTHTRRPSFREAALRNAIFNAVSIPNLVGPLLPKGVLRSTFSSSLPSLGLQLLLFAPMRRSNRYRAFHDRWSGTGVVSLPARAESLARVRTERRAATAMDGSRRAESQAYLLVRRLWSAPGGSLALAHDELLGRDIWVLETLSGPLPAPPPARPARLRLLRRSERPGAMWTAYEQSNGAPLLELLGRESTSWADVQPVLSQLLGEIEAGVSSCDLPEQLSLEQLWVDDFGQLKLLEFPARASSDGVSPTWPRTEWAAFLAACAERMHAALSPAAGGARLGRAPGQAAALLQTLGKPGLARESLADLRSRIDALPGRPVPIRQSLRLAHLLVGQFLMIASVLLLAVGLITALARGREQFHDAQAGIVVLTLMSFVMIGLPSIALALAFRGGPMLRLFGIRVADAHGLPASRARCTFRAALASSPILFVLVVSFLAGVAGGSTDRKPVARSHDRTPAPTNLDFEGGLAKSGGRDSRPGLPAGWIVAGSRPDRYEFGADRAQHHGGGASAFVSSATPDTAIFGTLMQDFAPAAFAGHRVRLTAFAKSEGVRNWAGVWMRVDGRWRILAFDNMQGRAIRGTTDWTRYEVVLDVPTDATNVAFGVLLAGAGKVWMDDLAFDLVGPGVATTGAPISPARGMGQAASRLASWLRLGNAGPSRAWMVMAALALSAIVTTVGWMLAIAWPSRSLHDRIAGTRLMTQ